MSSIAIPKYPITIPLRLGAARAKAGDDKSKGPVILTANEYNIRSLCSDDVNEAFLSWFNDPKMLSGLNIESLNFTADRLKSFIASFNNARNYFLGIFDGEEIVGFYTIDVNFTHKTGSITTGIGNKKYLGKHTLWSTINPVLDYFYENRDIEKFTARILAKNYPMLFNFKSSRRFALEAHLKRECRAPDGNRVDLLVFASHKHHTAQRVDQNDATK